MCMQQKWLSRHKIKYNSAQIMFNSRPPDASIRSSLVLLSLMNVKGASALWLHLPLCLCLCLCLCNNPNTATRRFTAPLPPDFTPQSMYGESIDLQPRKAQTRVFCLLMSTWNFIAVAIYVQSVKSIQRQTPTQLKGLFTHFTSSGATRSFVQLPLPNLQRTMTEAIIPFVNQPISL